MLDQLRSIVGFKDFFRQLVSHQLRQRYQASVLGLLWAVLNPLLIYASFCLIFSLINHWDLKEYGVYFFSGYIAWTFFTTASLLAADSVVGNAGYVTRVYVPKAVFPLSSVAVSLVDLAASFAVLAVLMQLLGASFTRALLILPVSIVLLTIFVTGVCLIVAMWTVFLRDFRHLFNSVLFVWFFFCPILYRWSVLPQEARRYLALNPMLPFLRLFQDPISAGTLPAAQDLVASAIIAFTTVVVGFAMFLKAESRFYYYV
jgi:ABC-2 type transport system permease protein